MWYIHTMEYHSFLKKGTVMDLMCPSLTRVHVCSAVSDSLPARLLCPWDSPGKNTGVGCHALLQGIFLTQGSNLCLCGFCTGRRILYHCATWGSPTLTPHRIHVLKSEPQCNVTRRRGLWEVIRLRRGHKGGAPTTQ